MLLKCFQLILVNNCDTIVCGVELKFSKDERSMGELDRVNVGCGVNTSPVSVTPHVVIPHVLPTPDGD